jgi:hypothetical protein
MTIQTAIKDRPITLMDWEVRAVLDGATQIRRVVKPQPIKDGDYWFWFREYPDRDSTWIQWSEEDLRELIPHAEEVGIDIPHYKPGRRLWVRERFFAWSGGAAGLGDDILFDGDTEIPSLIEDNNALLYDRELSNGIVGKWSWHAAITMPHWASRITLEVVSVVAGRVQEITAEMRAHDIWDMGYNQLAPRYDVESLEAATDWLIAHWNADNPKYPWRDNPWNWVYEVRRLT